MEPFVKVVFVCQSDDSSELLIVVYDTKIPAALCSVLMT